MKISKKKIIGIIIVLVIALTIILINRPFGQIIVYSNQTPIDSDPSSIVKENPDRKATAQANHGMIINDSLNSTTFQREITIPESYMKVSIQNNKSQNITFTVNKDHSSGQQVLSGTVQSTKTYQGFYTPAMLASGTYIITVSSGSAEMRGQLKVHIDTDINKLQADS